MYEIFFSARFKKDFKRLKKQGRDVTKLSSVLQQLAAGKELPPSMHDHRLVGNYHGHRECHIEPDWLLIYRIDEGELILTATRTGSHADLLDK